MKKILILILASLMLMACERPSGNDPRQAFVGDYDFVSKGKIALYAGSLKIITIPLDKEGEMSFSLADKASELWLVSEGDSTTAHIYNDRLFIEPTTEQRTYGDVVMTLSYTYGGATLEGDQLSMTTNVDVKATYKERSLTGRGRVDLTATKK